MNSQILIKTDCSLDSSAARHNVDPELEHLSTIMPPPTITDSIRSQSRMSISHAKGLLNMPGQNNCFLNSAVQVLWHLDIFRRSFRELHGHACMGDSCIFCALKELFNQFQHSKAPALPPDSLRFALAEAFSDQRRFQLGFMDDAAECFENILFRIHYHITDKETDCSSKCSPHCIPHQKFAMNLYEQIICNTCGAMSEPFVFSQMVHYTSTSALCVQAKNSFEKQLSFGCLLKMASSMGDIRNCPKMCGNRINIKKTLINRPDVISIGLVWDSEHPTLNLIRSVFQLIEASIKLHEVFDLSPEHKQTTCLNLVGLVTYYGKHYSTYLYQVKLNQWIYFDDATVRVIGPHWQQVMDKCVKGHFQPLLLLYSNPNGTVVDTQYALTEIVPMTVLKTKQRNDQCKMPPPPQVYTANMPSTVFASNEALNPEIHTQPKYLNSMDRNVQCVNKASSFRNSYSDVPDSPSATSTTSYFSDIGDSTDGYISRKTVENIMKIQRNTSSKIKEHKVNNFNKKCNRNSSSSLESFDSTIRPSTIPRGLNTNNLVCSLQRRDSGNSSGDRSSSVSSRETPFYPYSRSHQNPYRHKSLSDQGYDSFSLSSSDSYPSVATSPSKMNKLKQIPEDVQLIDSSSMTECDKLCSEADILLLRSHEKEREGDLRAAAALSDSAAAKARVAMDAPYSNHQTLISAKMKHSMCVMRSASLHKRVQEIEDEEKRLLKASQEYHHSRQSSRDSTHGQHSRQGSRDSKDPKSSKENKIDSKQTSNGTKTNDPTNLEIYATLPKRVKKKLLFKSSNSSLINDEHKQMVPNYAVQERVSFNSIISELKTGRNKLSGSIKDSDYSDYYSEWEGLKKKNVQKNITANVGPEWQSSRENDSECYEEIGGPMINLGKKQCKVKRKLLLANLLKTKNRSLPDLREDAIKENSQRTNLKPNRDENHNPNRSNIAKISTSTKGFHQSHRSFVTEQGVNISKPSLVKVQPPLVTKDKPTRLSFKTESVLESNSSSKTAPVPSQEMKKLPLEENSTPERINPFLQEINKKRDQILKRYKESCDKEISSEACNTLLGQKQRKPSSLEIASFISKNTALPIRNGSLQRNSSKNSVLELANRFEDLCVPNIPSKEISSVDHAVNSKSIRMPIAIHASNYISQMRPNRPPDYETTIKRINMNFKEKQTRFPSPPPVSQNIYSNMSMLANENYSDVSTRANPEVSGWPKVNLPREIPVQGGAISQIKPINQFPMESIPSSFVAKKLAQDKRKKIFKKSVKFSDQIELVACADDDPEEHLPNPLFEKVLGKNFAFTMNQQQQL